MSLEILLDHPLATDAEGKLKTRIASIFLDRRVLITLPRMTHAMQRIRYTDQLDAGLKNEGL